MDEVRRKRPYLRSREERFARYTRRDAPPTGVQGYCWIWTRRKDRDGYGRIEDGGRTCQAHIVSYEHHIGPVPDGKDVGQICKRHACCNPDHLIVQTRTEQVNRGDAPTAIVHRTNICKAGHELTPDNTIHTSDGYRTCRLCRQARQREYLERKRST